MPTMSKPKIAILTEGFSAESNISLLSAKKFHEWIDKSIYEPYFVHITEELWYVKFENEERSEINKNDFSFMENGKAVHFDLATFFPLHGPPAEDGKIQGYLDMLKIPYTGCGVLSSALSFDKSACKDFLRNRGIMMAKSILCLDPMDTRAVREEIEKNLSLPLFIKPNKNGSSYGVSKIYDWAKLEEAIQKAFDFDSEVIVEEFIAGREFSCGVYQLAGETKALPPTEIISETDFFDYNAKYLGKSNEVTPADLSVELTRQIQHLSLTVFKALACKTLSRMDFILKEGSFYFLEANTTPGITNESLVPQQLRAAGIDVPTFFNSILAERLKSK